MDEDRFEAVARTLRASQAGGTRPVELARMAKDELGEDFRAINVVKVFRDAFEIPLPVLKSATCWQGFALAPDDTALSDDEFDRLLEPWLGPER
ncbi:hypothetical protein [Nocardia mexicana]|uniref:Uncharacterized protein n=1 Tax=Nocardia mexicana TaxID=279262 RepID=A0A370H4H6_9NOCA|nr:hypothetical protein [Nocardia mexicana]RDI50142.1 hypothetical protein DFR68_106581 [Nocardia mexicana]